MRNMHAYFDVTTLRAKGGQGREDGEKCSTAITSAAVAVVRHAE